MMIRTASGQRWSTIVVAIVTLVLMVTMFARLPVGVDASTIRSVASASESYAVTNSNTATTDTARLVQQRRVAPESVSTLFSEAVVREKRTLLKLKPLVVLPAKVALGAGAKLVAGAKLGVKAVGLGAKALGVGAIGLKAVKKVAKVTVKAATALGIKAVLINFLFQKINQVIDFKTRLLSNLDQRNRQQNAQFLSPVLPQSSSAVKSSGSVGNKDDDDFLASGPASDQQGLGQEQSKSSYSMPSVAPLEDDEVTFDANKVSLQVPDTLFGPSFTAVNGISQTIGNVIQNAANRLAQLVEAVKAAIWRKASGISSISNSSGSFTGNGDTAVTGTRGSRDAAAHLSDDTLDRDPLDEAASAAAATVAPSNKRSADSTATNSSKMNSTTSGDGSVSRV